MPRLGDGGPSSAAAPPHPQSLPGANYASAKASANDPDCRQSAQQSPRAHREKQDGRADGEGEVEEEEAHLYMFISPFLTKTEE